MTRREPQPIKTAPKDGRDILLWHGRWNVGGWTNHHDDSRYKQMPSWVINGGYVVRPTQWCPLPEAPGTHGEQVPRPQNLKFPVECDRCGKPVEFGSCCECGRPTDH